MEVIFYYRYGTIYRQVMKTPKINFCAVMKAAIETPLLSVIIDIAKSVEPSMIHECPYVNLIAKNKPLTLSALPTIFSQGDYRVTLNFTTRNNEEFLFIEFLLSWISSEKNSFGWIIFCKFLVTLYLIKITDKAF